MPGLFDERGRLLAMLVREHRRTRVFASGAAGLRSNGLVAANPVSEVVRVRVPSYARANVTYHFGVKVER